MKLSKSEALDDFNCELNCIFNFTQHVRRSALSNGISGDNAVLTALQLRNMVVRLTRHAYAVHKFEEQNAQPTRPTRIK